MAYVIAMISKPFFIVPVCAKIPTMFPLWEKKWQKASPNKSPCMFPYVNFTLWFVDL